MPDGYMLDIWVLISNFLDCMLQPMRETLLVGFEIGPASVELVFAMGVLSCLAKVWIQLQYLHRPTRDCQLSSMIRFVTETYKSQYKDDWDLECTSDVVLLENIQRVVYLVLVQILT